MNLDKNLDSSRKLEVESVIKSDAGENGSSSDKEDLISAGELGQFVFCPEAYRLAKSEPLTDQGREASSAQSVSDRVQKGLHGHHVWGQTVDRLEAVRVGVRVLFGLAVVACLLYRFGG